jgi:lipoprotein NlpD|tara:strand:+ start:17 stop:772 length:756 start_codon:yes stop_codon:yes gene_type:complete
LHTFNYYIPEKILTWISCLFIILLSGCTTPTAPVSHRQQPATEKINHHIVSSGETLFSIAWRYEIDPKRLAGINNIKLTDKIFTEQRLSLNSEDLNKRKKIRRLSAPETIQGSSYSVKNTKPLPLSNERWKWRWPVKGKILKKFNNSKLFKGIDIESDYGSPVFTAAPGVVVYSGDGLRSYGKLIIIRHDENYLSAYAHNKEIFVKENEAVIANQKISESGYTETKNQHLYFEIRKRGKPVDPLAYLPKPK